jgi:FkbM family methyltransferase
VDLPTEDRVTRTKGGDVFLANLSSQIEWAAWVFGSYEPIMAKVLASRVGPGDVCLDVGANVDLHTIRMARLGAHVHAFEPVPDLRNPLEQYLALNALENVTVHDTAVAADNGEVELFVGDTTRRNRGMASLYETSVAGGATVVRAVRIDDLGFPRVDLMKIDVQGAETDVLKGAVATLERDRPVVLFEYLHAHVEETGHNPLQFISDLGFRVNEVEYLCPFFTGHFRVRPLTDRIRTGNRMLIAEA